MVTPLPSLHGDSIKIAQSPTAHAKIRRVLDRAPITINLLFVNHARNGPSDKMDLANGMMSSYEASKAFGIDIPYSSDALTVVFGHNQGDDRMPFTPWVIAHRIMHAIWNADRGERSSAFFPLLHQLNRIPVNLPPDVIDPLTLLDIDSLIHTVEFIGEAFAHYLITGHIVLVPIGTTIKAVLARRSKILYPNLEIPTHVIRVRKPVFLNQVMERWKQDAEAVFLNTLRNLRGRILMI